MPTQATATSTLSITKNLITMAMSTLICSVKGMLGKYRCFLSARQISSEKMESRPNLHVIFKYTGCVSSTAVHPLHAMTMAAEQQCNIFINYTTLNGQEFVCRNNTAVDCSLNFSPCTFDGILYNTVPMMQDLGFNVTDPMDFAEGYVGCPAYGALVSCCTYVHIKTSCMLGSAAYARL